MVVEPEKILFATASMASPFRSASFKMPQATPVDLPGSTQKIALTCAFSPGARSPRARICQVRSGARSCLRQAPNCLTLSVGILHDNVEGLILVDEHDLVDGAVRGRLHRRKTYDIRLLDWLNCCPGLE